MNDDRSPMSEAARAASRDLRVAQIDELSGRLSEAIFAEHDGREDRATVVALCSALERLAGGIAIDYGRQARPRAPIQRTHVLPALREVLDEPTD